MKRIVLVAAAAAALLTGAVAASPAAAARQINGPAWFVCDKYAATVSVSPPRVWGSHRTEHVLWISQIQRWNSSTEQWYKYGSPKQSWGSFTYSGMNVTSWSGHPQTHSYHANTMNFKVQHRGYYRVASVVNGNQGGVTWSAFVGGRDNHCYVS